MGKHKLFASPPAEYADEIYVGSTGSGPVAGATAVDGKKISNVVVLDNEGNTINKKNYTVTVLDETGADVTKAKLAAGKEYTLVIKAAKDVVATDEDGVSVTVKAGYNLAKAKVDAKSVSKTYTGEAIELDADDMAKIKVTYSGKALEFGTDYEIAGYTNNIKKGNMKVTIRGIGEFSGSKTFKVKIAPKPISSTN